MITSGSIGMICFRYAELSTDCKSDAGVMGYWQGYLRSAAVLRRLAGWQPGACPHGIQTILWREKT